MENSKLTGMIVTDLRKEIAEQYKEIECLKKSNEEFRAKNKELTDMLEISWMRSAPTVPPARP